MEELAYDLMFAAAVLVGQDLIAQHVNFILKYMV